MEQRYYKDSELAVRYSVSRATIWRWVKNGLLPKPIQLSVGSTRWEREAIEALDSTRGAAA
tara:strand:+ start:353 stop:535 length:183 start_codon:yes stop_codon:yes gene_type:complete